MRATPSRELLRTLGEFTLGEVLGEGGSGIVYAASSARHTEVALKVLREELALSEQERHRFFDEVERMRRVRHPSLVPLIDAGVLPCGRPYLCMPLLRAETVAARVQREGRMPPGLALGSFAGLAEGVQALHHAGLVHRDIKPENVLLDDCGRAILLDFGIARDIRHNSSTTTLRGSLRGTPLYMAPERFFGTPATVATDIYELGVLLYTMLVGTVPWDADGPNARLRPLLPGERNVELPAALVSLLMRALSTRPETRPESATSFAREALCALEDRSEARPPTRDIAMRAALADPPVAGEGFKPVRGAVVAARYRLDQPLGRGGMGEVWAATHVVTRKAVALKFLRAEVACERRCRRRFLREAQAASRVRHPNVIQIHDVIELDVGVPIMVMDLLEGESLGERLARERVLSLTETARVLLPVASAVAAAHRRGVVHRDLKPDNIFLARVGGESRVVVLDFGIAKVMDREDGRPAETWAKTTASEAAMLGTPVYMSPEQLYGDRDIDHRTDVWALGVILYECLAGRRPTQAESLGQVLKIVTQKTIVPIERLAPDLSPRLAALIRAMLSAERENRPTLATVRRELEEACRAPDALGAVVAPRSFSGAVSGRSSQRALAAGSVALAGILVVALGGAWRRREPVDPGSRSRGSVAPSIAASDSPPLVRAEQAPREEVMSSAAPEVSAAAVSPAPPLPRRTNTVSTRGSARPAPSHAVPLSANDEGSLFDRQ